jgi:glycosyltransferase involved in cell wall biosynthesis
MTTGIAEPRKNLEGLIKAFGRVPTELRSRYQLLLVCQATEADQLRLKGIARNAGLTDDDLVITGFVTDDDLVALYRSTSLFVFPSLHEGFGLPALEAMACGAPVIGSNVTSLPEAIGKADALFNPLLLDDMAAMISRALGDTTYRESLLAHAAVYPSRFSWDETGRRALRAFEDAVGTRELSKGPSPEPDAARDSKNSLYPKLLKFLSALSDPSDDADWVAAASSIALNQRADRPKQLLVDVSILSAFDAKSGIQRVTRAVVMQLLSSPPSGWQVRPVRVDRAALKYRYADEFARTMGGPEQGTQQSDDWVDPSSGDIFLGLDLAADIVPQTQPWFEALRRRGVKIYFVVYDLLPILRPEWFSEGIAAVFSPWLTTLGAVSDGVVAISKAVADDLAAYYEQHVPTRHTDLKIGYFHLGADIHSTNPSVGLAEDSEQVLASLKSQPTMLMVGTVEPRKGYAQAIAAFDLLWKAGVKVNLVIVGKAGWHQEKLIESLEGDPQMGKQLFWLRGVSDEYLDRVYEASTCLLAASEGEGFGLPLIEAAQKNLPILARDLPVFREVAGEHAFYFSGAKPQDLATAIEQWLALSEQSAVPLSTALPWLTWEQSTRGLEAVVVVMDANGWYRSVKGSPPPFRRGDH